MFEDDEMMASVPDFRIVVLCVFFFCSYKCWCYSVDGLTMMMMMRLMRLMRMTCPSLSRLVVLA